MIITQRLHGDHLSFLKLLGQMEKAVQKSGMADVRRLRSAFSLLYPLMKIHEKAEETLLFPFLLDASPEIRHQAESLEHEHDELHTRSEKLFDLLSVRKPDGSQIFPVLQSYSRLLRHHIEKEDQTFFPAAEKILDKCCLENLSRDLSELVRDMGPIKRPWHERRKS